MQWFRGGTAVEVIAVRLDAGEDLRTGLARVAEELSLGAAVVLSGQGVLSQAALVAAGEILIEKPGPLRIASLQGTLFGGSVELSLTLSRSGEPFAGAAREGCVVDPGAECVLLRVGQLSLAREADAGGVPRLQAAERPMPGDEPIRLMGQPVDMAAVALVPRRMLQRHSVIPLQRSGNVLVVAMADIADIIAIDDLRLATGLQIRPVAVPPEELRAALARLLGRP